MESADQQHSAFQIYLATVIRVDIGERPDIGSRISRPLFESAIPFARPVGAEKYALAKTIVDTEFQVDRFIGIERV